MADLVYVAEACVVLPLSGGLAAGWAANHTREIARSWTDGVERLSQWRESLRLLAAEVVPVAVLWLLTLVLPAHGTHRAPGVAR